MASQLNTTDTTGTGAFSRSDDLHLLRRIQHATSGILIVFLTCMTNQNNASILLGILALGLLVVNELRKRSESVQNIFLMAFGQILRPNEVYEIPSSFYFLLGSGLSLALFPKNIAQLSLLCLSLADPIAAIVGISIRGPRLIGNASMIGSLAYFCTSLVLGIAVLRNLPVALIAAAGSMLSEAFASIVLIDDNFLIPIVTGYVALFASQGFSSSNF